MLAANDLVVLLTLDLTDKSRGDSCVVDDDASDSNEFPLLDNGKGKGLLWLARWLWGYGCNRILCWLYGCI